MGVFAQKTVVYVVRHAERDLSDTANHDPNLSLFGHQRALDLAEMFKREKLSAIFSTPFKRTMQTVLPLAQGYKMEPLPYTNTAAIATRVMQEYKGKNVLIVAHSNTILPIVKAFGAKTSLTELVEDDYDWLFTVVIDDGKPMLYTKHYGRPHHLTEIP